MWTICKNVLKIKIIYRLFAGSKRISASALKMLNLNLLVPLPLKFFKPLNLLSVADGICWLKSTSDLKWY